MSKKESYEVKKVTKKNSQSKKDESLKNNTKDIEIINFEPFEGSKQKVEEKKAKTTLKTSENKTKKEGKGKSQDKVKDSLKEDNNKKEAKKDNAKLLKKDSLENDFNQEIKDKKKSVKEKESKEKKETKEKAKKTKAKEIEENEDKKENQESQPTTSFFEKWTLEVNDKIQSVISILFTIVIFTALFILIAVLYNNYLKPKEELDLEEVCKDFIPKDYHIETEMIGNFIKNARPVIYNIDNFDRDNITDNDMLQFATYFIWGNNEDYIVCQEDEEKCLTSKMTMPYETLKTYFHNYLDISSLKLNLEQDFQDDDETRLYMEDDNIVLTFSEFTYQSYKHDLIYENVKEDKVTLIFALENLVPNTNIYEYVGAKKIELSYKNKNLIIDKIETNLKSN